MTYDDIIKILLILCAVVASIGIGSFILIAFLQSDRPLFYHCPRCRRWQDARGNWGMKPPREQYGGENLCSLCERETRKRNK